MKKSLLKYYDSCNAGELLRLLAGRAEKSGEMIEGDVKKIIADVRTQGDAALYGYTEKYDGVKLGSLFLSEEKKRELMERVPAELRRTLERAAGNIKRFHNKQLARSWTDIAGGAVMGQRVLPLRRVGIYVPGGSAAYPSTVLMCAIPAAVAGVEEIIIATPPSAAGEVNPAVIYAASLAGVSEILTVGGAQAVAALAYGTGSVTPVDKIVGPGNIYVTAAKRLVYGKVDIDMLAGPSEVLVIADGNASCSDGNAACGGDEAACGGEETACGGEETAAYIAADLMSQAEHDPMAAAVLVTTSRTFAEKVETELERQIETLPRKDKIAESLKNYGSAVIVPDLDEAARLSDLIAPEHLELAVEDPFSLLSKIRNAGSVFLGRNTPEPLGDYMAGPNHVLPTNGTARFSSALSVDSFQKKSSYLYYGKEAFYGIADDVVRFAEAEGLEAHANSIKIRLGGGEK